jgi:GNAT superfamily N-acetyltransferase
MLMRIERINEFNIDALLETAEAFFYESRYRSLDLDLDLYRSILTPLIDSNENACILIMDGDVCAGYSIICCVQEFTKQPIGDMYQMYVRKEYRGTGVGRMIAKEVTAQFDLWGCPISYVGSDTGISSQASNVFKNLWKKFGFNDTGVTMSREL